MNNGGSGCLMAVISQRGWVNKRRIISEEYIMHPNNLAFLQGLDADLKQSVINRLRDLWTHTSTALEGNTLTLGDTQFILENGLTVSGKAIVEHNEICGHARAIDLIYSMLGRDITKEDFFNLHKAVQTEKVFDIDKPNGAWKSVPNGTYVTTEDDKQCYLEYASPADVDDLITELISYMNSSECKALSVDNCVAVYARIHAGLAHIHPFWDGNGRISRLIANIPLLNSGLLPILIRQQDRREYISHLSSYQLALGEINKQTSLWPDLEKLAAFTDFCERSYFISQQVVDEAWAMQRHRNS